MLKDRSGAFGYRDQEVMRRDVGGSAAAGMGMCAAADLFEIGHRIGVILHGWR